MRNRKAAHLKTRARFIVTISIVTLLGLMSLAPSASGQVYTDLYNFGSTATDVQLPGGFLAQGIDGNVYGTAAEGASNDTGGVFRITTAGSPTVLASFASTVGNPNGMIASSDGNLYGTTAGAGTTCTGGVDCGILFSVTTSGVFADIHDFKGGHDGEEPQAPPLEGLDHRLYGATAAGGAFNKGTLYIATATGEVAETGNKGDGSTRILAFDPNSNLFYGVSANTVFKLNHFGITTVLHNFGSSVGPWTLVQSSDGSLYGTTFSGGDTTCNNGFGCGMVFRINRSGTFAVVHNFHTSDGRAPTTLLLASDGNLYGATQTDVTNNAGTIFKVASDGAFSVLYNFVSATGLNPSSLLQDTNGTLYGLTQSGGTNNRGVFFSFDLGLPSFARLLPFWGSTGDTVGILGQGLLGTTAVSFNGVAATFHVVSDTYVTVQVPSGATSGGVTVTTSTGSLTSNSKFVVE